MANLRRVRTVATGVAGTPWYTNWYFTYTIGTEQDHIDLAVQFWTDIQANLDNSVTWTVEGDCAIVDDSTGAIVGVESGTGAAVAGTETASALPPANQALIHWLTGSFIGGRQIRGRTFIPGLCTDQTGSTGQLVAGARTDYSDAAGALITNSSSPGPLRVFSRRNGTSAVVQTATVPIVVSVMRSRRD